MTRLLDPTGEPVGAPAAATPRLASLAGMTIGLLDISKPRGDVFLDRVDELLRDLGATVERYRKHSYAKIAPDDLRRLIAARCHAVVEALAD